MRHGPRLEFGRVESIVHTLAALVVGSVDVTLVKLGNGVESRTLDLHVDEHTATSVAFFLGKVPSAMFKVAW